MKIIFRSLINLGFFNIIKIVKLINNLSKIKNKTLLVRTIKLSLVSLVSNFLGFLIPIYIAFEYKISKETDSFFLSYTIILFIGVVFSGAVRSVSIPFLQERLEDKIKLNQFISAVYFYCFIFFFVITAIVAIVTLVMYQHSNNIFYWYLFLSSPIILLTILNSFSYGILNSLNQFNIAEMSPLSRSIVIFGMIFFLKDTFGLSAVIIGYNLGELAKFFHLYYVVVRVNKIKISLKNNTISILKDFLKDGASQVLATTISASSPLIDRFVASFLFVGSISLIDYGDRLFVVFNVLLNAFLAILLSRWSTDAISKKFSYVEMNKIIYLLFGICLVLLGFIYLTRSLIVDILYPTIIWKDREIIAMILFVNMIGFVFNASSQIVNRAMIALKFTNLMVITSSIKAIINIILDIIFAYYWGVVGIIYATVGVHFFGLIVNYFLFYRRFKSI